MTGFADLHHAAEPLFLPNAWDHASAMALAAQGFGAVGTTSLGVAAAAGLRDGASATRDETLRLALTLGTEAFFLSVDAEGGFSEDPGEVGSSRVSWRPSAPSASTWRTASDLSSAMPRRSPP